MRVPPSVDLMRQHSFLKALLDSMQIGIIIADANGYLIYINQAYARFLNVDIEACIGRHANAVVSNSRLHDVARSGLLEINYPHRFQDTGYLVHRVPIKEDGQVVAVLGLVLFDSATTAVKLAEKLAGLESKLASSQQELAALHTTRYTFDSIIGQSPAMHSAKTEGVRAAANNLSVLITGESGTGKELVAQAIHRASARSAYPFVRVNCAALPKSLLEAELFGYEKGAFTGANPKGKPGKFEIAHLGTIFMDEIGDMPLDMQPKLLRVLEMKEFERVGGTALLFSDFRVIAATNQNLEQLMQSGFFRRDLFYRLNVVPIELPPLRQRREDIMPMAYHFIQNIVKGPAGKGIRIRREAEEALVRYDWPGNGRELFHAFQRMLYGRKQDTIGLADLPDYIQQAAHATDKPRSTRLSDCLRATEIRAIEDALCESGGNRTRAARRLGIHRTLLYRKMKRLDIL